MNSTKAVIFCYALLASIALAQEPNPYNGTWRASGEDFIDSEFVLQGEGGKWKTYLTAGRRRFDACAAMERPIIVQRSSAEGLVFLINGSKVLSGCPDIVVTLKPIDAKSLAGLLGTGVAFKAVRQ